MRLIDKDKLLDFIRFDERVIAPEEHTAQDIVMMIQTAPTITPPPNGPLTLEELREMDGEPVWVDCLTNPKCSCWGYHDEDGFSGYCAYFDDEEYGKVWLAYRRKPEEGEHGSTD